MSKDTKRLGKGIEALFTANTDLDLSEMVASIETAEGYTIKEVPLEKLRANPFQPRKNFDEDTLNELAESIREHGIIQPLVVRKSTFGYDILAGERRFRAAKLAGLSEVPVVEKDFDDKQMMELAILENIQREDLDIIEEAKGYEALISNFAWTQQVLAERMGKSRSHVTNTLRLLTLPAYIQKLLVEKKLTMGHAKVLVGLEPKITEVIIETVLSKELSVRATEELVARYRNQEEGSEENTVKKEQKDTDTAHVEKELTEYLGLKTQISAKKLTINFSDIAELNQFLERIGFDLNKL